MKVAVIVTDASQGANVSGGVCQTTFREFSLPDCITSYIKDALKNKYTNVSLVIEDEPK